MGNLSLFSLFFLLFFGKVQAGLLQILHTNDLHSHFEHGIHDKELGGFAQLKTLIDYYREWGEEKGIPTLVVDSGDLMEGSFFYMADDGRVSLNMYNRLGYDIAVIGNHDYLMGSASLNSILGDVEINFSYIGANFYTHGGFENIERVIQPYVEKEIDGVKIAFLGLTTSELFYSWRIQEGGVSNPYKAGRKFEKVLKKRGNDVIIALTHLGLNRDIKLARGTKYIDMIIGGHSHDLLLNAVSQKNRKNKIVPIVQAGAHGEYLGRLLINIDKQQGFQGIQEYKVIEVRNYAKDRELAEDIKLIKEELYNSYEGGKEWWEEIIGWSDLQKRSREEQIVWNFFVTDAIRGIAKSDVAIHQPDMSGDNYPVGPITRKDIFEGHPRIFEFSQRYGWSIYRAKIRGWFLQTFFAAALNFHVPLAITGVNFKWKKNILGKYVVSDIRIKGKKIDLLKYYVMAIPDTFVRAGRILFPWLAKYLFRDAVQLTDEQNRPVTIMSATIKKVFQVKVIGKLQRNAAVADDHLFIPGNP